MAVKPGQTITLGGYLLTFKGMSNQPGPNYTSTAARFELRDGAALVAELAPAKRVYIGRQMPTSETARYRYGFSEVYLAIGEVQDDTSVDLRAYNKPFVLFIWLGPLIMGIGGMLSLSDRRLRVGAPRQAQRGKPQGATA